MTGTDRYITPEIGTLTDSNEHISLLASVHAYIILVKNIYFILLYCNTLTRLYLMSKFVIIDLGYILGSKVISSSLFAFVDIHKFDFRWYCLD